MNRLFYGVGALSTADGYRHLMKDDVLSRELVDRLIEDYVVGPDVLIYLNAQECNHCSKDEAFPYIERIFSLGTLRLAPPDFQARMLIEPIGVGVGSKKLLQRTPSSSAE